MNKSELYNLICEIVIYEEVALSYRSLSGLCEKKVVYEDHNWDRQTEDFRLLTEESSDYIRKTLSEVLPRLTPLSSYTRDMDLEARCLDGSIQYYAYDKCVEKVFDHVAEFEKRYYEKMFSNAKNNIKTRPTPYLIKTAEESANYTQAFEVLTRCIQREEYKEFYELLSPACTISIPTIPRLRGVSSKEDVKKEFYMLGDTLSFKFSVWDLETTLCGWVKEDLETDFYIIVTAAKKKQKVTDIPDSKNYFMTLKFDAEGRIQSVLMNDVRPAGDKKVRSLSDREIYSIKKKGINDFEDEPVKSISVNEISILSKENTPKRFEWTEKKNDSKQSKSDAHKTNTSHQSNDDSGFVALKCPSCGAPLTFNKEDGTYNCTYCGVSFIMKEPPRKTPNDALNMARREYEKDRYSDARKYYALALQEDPDCWEADLGVSTCDMLKSKWNDYRGEQFKSDVERIKKQINKLPADEACEAKFTLGKMIADVAVYCNNNLEDPVNDAWLRHIENSRRPEPDVRSYTLDLDIKGWLRDAAELMVESEPGSGPIPQEKVDIIEYLFNYVYAKDKYVIRTGYGTHPIDDYILSVRDRYMEELKKRNPLYKFIENVRIRY